MTTSKERKLRFLSRRDLNALPQIQRLDRERLEHMDVVARVLPFRTNNYVVEELIDWDEVPNDPMFQLTFPQPGMLSPAHLERMTSAVRGGDPARIRAAADAIRMELNPHPEGQLQNNVPCMDGEAVAGIQHKYRETCLVFPSAGQTCHAYCSFCFRWAQFVGIDDLKFATDEAMRFCEYIRRHHEITDVLITGGDPLVMRTDVLARYVEPLLRPEFDHVQTIRIGTKSLSFWPYRYLTERDSDALLRLFERIIDSGKHVALMAHFNHGQELSTDAVETAIARIQSTGAVVRTQAPLIRHINDDADVWADLWDRQVHLRCLPYYMFVERNTGARDYFKVPLYRAFEIYREAVTQVSGLARTARGPVMSALPGKVVIEGSARIGNEDVFVLSFLQARDPEWCKRPFFARFDPEACWLDDLRPAFGEPEFFHERPLRELLSRPRTAAVRELVS